MFDIQQLHLYKRTMTIVTSMCKTQIRNQNEHSLFLRWLNYAVNRFFHF